MNTKSRIQIITEMIETRSVFFDNLKIINEKYEVVNNVFACNDYGDAKEVCTGYFVDLKEYDTIEEAKDTFDISKQAIRISEGKYWVGNLYNKLSDTLKFKGENNIYSLKDKTIL